MELERWLENVVRNPVTQTNSKTLTQASFGYVEIFHTKSWENLEISWEISWFLKKILWCLKVKTLRYDVTSVFWASWDFLRNLKIFSRNLKIFSRHVRIIQSQESGVEMSLFPYSLVITSEPLPLCKILSRYDYPLSLPKYAKMRIKWLG